MNNLKFRWSITKFTYLKISNTVNTMKPLLNSLMGPPTSIYKCRMKSSIQASLDGGVLYNLEENDGTGLEKTEEIIYLLSTECLVFPLEDLT